MAEKTVEEKIDRAKAKLLIDNRFFGALALYFDIKETKKAPTAYTDSKGIYYNYNFVDKCTPNEVTGLILHELLHNYFKHFIRFDIINKNKLEKHYLNMAMDYAINGIIKHDAKNVELPCYKRDENGNWVDGVIGENMAYDDKYIGWNAEKILQDLKNSEQYKDDKKKFDEFQKLVDELNDCQSCGGNGENEKGEPCQDCQGSGKQIPKEFNTDIDKSHQMSSEESGEVVEEKGGVDKSVEEMDSKIHRAFNALSIKDKGKVPQQMKMVIDEYMERLKGKINWKKYLKSKIQEMGKEQYTMQKYNRRYMGRGIYLPSTMGKKIVIGMALDTSGSIGRTEQEEFIGEIKSVMTQFTGVEVLLYGCDSAIHGKMKLKGKKQFKVKSIEECLIGGGGTSHNPIFKDIKENHEKIKMLFCFTDGYSDINNIPKNMRGKFSTYWVLPENCKDVELDWGKKVIIFDEHKSKK